MTQVLEQNATPKDYDKRGTDTEPNNFTVSSTWSNKVCVWEGLIWTRGQDTGGTHQLITVEGKNTREQVKVMKVMMK